MVLANTSNYPFDLAGNNASGWYEYRDTGDALTQQGYQVALGQIAIKDASWTENGQSVIDDLTFDDDTETGTAPCRAGRRAAAATRCAECARLRTCPALHRLRSACARCCSPSRRLPLHWCCRCTTRGMRFEDFWKFTQNHYSN